MNAAQTALPGGRSIPKESASWRPDCLAFLKRLDQAAKVIALYKVSHPAAVTAVGEVYKAFESVLEATGCDRLTLALANDRWLVNGADLAPAALGPETLRRAFQGRAFTSLSFLQGACLYEFSALCESLKELPGAGDAKDLRECLLRRGVRRILADTAVYSLAPEPPAQAPPPPADAAPRRSGSFAGLLKNLVEGAVEDPVERASVYAEALGMLKQALDRQVAASTSSLKQERERMLKEQDRAETLLSTVAAGEVVVDKEGKVLMMNPAAEQITGKRLAELAGRPIDEAADSEDRMVALSADLRIEDDRRLSREIRVMAEQEVGRALTQSLAVIHDESGRVVGTYSVLPDAAKFKEARKAEEDFVSRVSHDLKAPLASICCALELISEKLGPTLGPQESEYIGICLKNSRNLEEMIRKILDFSKLDGGRLNVTAVDAAAEPMLREAVEGLTPWARRGGIALTALPCEPGLSVRADHLRVVEILNNLVSNAVKSTPRGGRITVGARAGAGPRRGFAVFTVSDTGPGIPPADLERIFDKFVRLEQGGDRDGVGLGLTIVKELVRLHGGEVWVESRLGQGSAFSFTLPLSADA